MDSLVWLKSKSFANLKSQPYNHEQASPYESKFVFLPYDRRANVQCSAALC